MSRIVIGTIPEKITYVYSCGWSVNVGCYWDIDYLDKNSAKETVNPTFVLDANNDKALIKAKSWAEEKNRVWDDTKRVWIQNTTPITITTLDNNPIKNVRILSLEYRGEGGRAYKVLLDEKYYVDLREDVLIDIILKVGILPNGILNGEYIWGKLGNQMRLVRVGSELHKLLQESNKKKDLPKLKKSELEVGAIYQARNGVKAIFLGYVNTTHYDCPGRQSFDFEKTAIRKAMLFLEPLRRQTPEEALKENAKEIIDYQFKICKTHNYIEKIGDVKVDTDFVTLLRKKANNKIKENILEFTGHKPPERNYAKIDKHTLIYNICYYSDRLNLSHYGSTITDLFDVKKYLVFS